MDKLTDKQKELLKKCKFYKGSHDFSETSEDMEKWRTLERIWVLCGRYSDFTDFLRDYLPNTLSEQGGGLPPNEAQGFVEAELAEYRRL